MFKVRFDCTCLTEVFYAKLLTLTSNGNRSQEMLRNSGCESFQKIPREACTTKYIFLKKRLELGKIPLHREFFQETVRKFSEHFYCGTPVGGFY